MKKIAISKNHQVDIEIVFTALAHVSRRHILYCLSQKGAPMLGGEIADQLSCSWPTTTGHLQVLTKAGLITVHKNGREKIYSLNYVRLAVVQKWILDLKPK